MKKQDNFRKENQKIIDELNYWHKRYIVRELIDRLKGE